MTILEIVAEVARRHQVAPRAVLSRSRDAYVTRVRLTAYREARDRGWSYSAIGRQMKRDHTSVIYGVRRARERGW